MTPQHPAAPEGETDASGLTEAERDALRGLAFTVPDRIRLEAAVKRIVAERLRVVEGELDAALDRYAEREQRWYWALIKEQNATARAESAEARLRAVEALAEEWDATPDFRAYYGDHARDLRARLAGDGE